MSGDFLQIKPLLLSALERALNGYLALDAHYPDLLTPLQGKVIAIHVTPFDETLYVCPSAERIQLLESYGGTADACLSGSLSALGLMGLSATPMRSLFRGEVRIKGDMQAAHKLQRLFEKLDINLQAKLARYTGESFAVKTAELFRGSRAWTQHSLTGFRLNLEEFLQEETRELPAKAEAELWCEDVDALRSDYDRLEARVARLEARANNNLEAE